MEKVTEIENRPNIDKLSSERWIYLDVCKIISMFFIVVTNLVSSVWGSLEVGSTDWNILTIYDSISRFSVPLFFLITGALTLNYLKELSIKEIYTKYLIPVTTAFLFWSTGTALFNYYIYSPEQLSDFDLFSFIGDVLRGDENLYWFVFLLMQFYFVVPILRQITKNRNICKYFIILWAVFALFPVTISRLELVVTDPPFFLSQIFEYINIIFERVRPLIVIEYSGYVILGHYIHTSSLKRKHAIWAIALFILSISYTTLMTFYSSNLSGEPNEIFFTNVSFNIAVAAASFMVILKVFTENVWYKDRTYKTIMFLSAGAFGIFLIHAFILRLLNSYGINALFLGPVISTPILSIGIALVCVTIAYLIRKVPVVGKYLV